MMTTQDVQVSKSKTSSEMGDILYRVKNMTLDIHSVKQIGLNEADLDDIKDKIAIIDIKDRVVPNLSESVSEKAFSMMNGGLEQCKLSSLDEVGEEIVNLMSFAEEGTVTRILNKTPVVNLVMRKVVNPVKRYKKEGETLVQNIHNLVDAVDAKSAGLVARVSMLDTAYNDIYENLKQISKNMIVIKGVIDKTNEQIRILQSEEQNEHTALEIRDLGDYVSRLETRLKNMITLYTAVFATLHSVRESQSTSESLIDKFENIREIVAPIMVYQGFIAEANHHNSEALTLANNIDDAVNRMLIKNSLKTKENAVESMAASQRLTIRMETVDTVCKNLQATRESIKTLQLNSRKELVALTQQAESVKRLNIQ